MIDRVTALGPYDAPLDRLIAELKFGKRVARARVLGELLAMQVSEQVGALPDLLVPVPMHWRREYLRGFNQSTLIADVLAKRLSVPVVLALRRTDARAPQLGQKRTKRLQRMCGAFEATRPVNGAHVAIIDDVLTTGATAVACARTLKTAGALHAELWAVAITTQERRV